VGRRGARRQGRGLAAAATPQPPLSPPPCPPWPKTPLCGCPVCSLVASSPVDFLLQVSSLSVKQPSPRFNLKLLTRLKEQAEAAHALTAGVGTEGGAMRPAAAVKRGIKVLVLRSALPPEGECPGIIFTSRQSYLDKSVGSCHCVSERTVLPTNVHRPCRTTLLGSLPYAGMASRTL